MDMRMHGIVYVLSSRGVSLLLKNTNRVKGLCHLVEKALF